MTRLAFPTTPYIREVPDPVPAGEDRGRALAANELSLVALIVACVAVAWAFPFPSVKYGLIVFFGVVLLLQTLRRPAIGLTLLAFGSPAISLVPPDLIPIRGINAETLLIGFALFIWFRQNQISGPDGLRSPLARMLGVYAVLIVVSSVVATFYWQVGLFDVLQKAKNHLVFLLFMPVAFHVLRERRDQVLILLACSLALVLNCVQAIQESFPAFVAGALERHRAIALMAQQPNTFGAALAVYLPFLALFALHRVGGRAFNLWFLLAAGTTGFTLLLTLSRGGWIAAAGAMLVVSLIADRRLLVVLVVVGATFTAWAPQQVMDRIQLTEKAEGDIGVDDQIVDDSAQMRVEQYKSLPAMMRASPIIGHGYKSYPRVFERYGTLRRAKGAHSSYCQVGTEEGLVGLGVLLAVLATMFAAGWRALKHCDDPFPKWIGAGVAGGSVAMALAMAFGARWEPQVIMVFFWILAGIAEREGILARDARRPVEPLAAVGPPRGR